MNGYEMEFGMSHERRLGVPFRRRCVGGIDPDATAGRHIRNGRADRGTADLDEARGVLYIANFRRQPRRCDVPQDKTIKTSYNVSPQPGSLALSPGRAVTW